MNVVLSSLFFKRLVGCFSAAWLGGWGDASSIEGPAAHPSIRDRRTCQTSLRHLNPAVRSRRLN